MIKDRIFIISCYFDGTNNAIFDCVNSLIANYDYPKILVIDSDSPNKSYFEKLRNLSVEVLDSKNKNYDTGAFGLVLPNIMIMKIIIFYKIL